VVIAIVRPASGDNRLYLWAVKAMAAARRDTTSIFMLSVALGCGALLIVLNFARWDLIDVLTPFLEPLLVELPLHGLFVAALVGSIVSLCLRLRRGWDWFALLPLAINLATIAAIVLIPFNEIIIDRDFHDHRAQRERVVADVASGALQPNLGYTNRMIHLSDTYGRVSKGGNDVEVGRGGDVLRVTFFTYRGILDNYSGFIYCADGIAPTEEILGGQIVEIEQYDARWYWVSMT
jgi:hypothetical protein